MMEKEAASRNLGRLWTLGTTQPQSAGVVITAEQEQGPGHKFIFWGVRWTGGRKTGATRNPKVIPVPE